MILEMTFLGFAAATCLMYLIYRQHKIKVYRSSLNSGQYIRHWRLAHLTPEQWHTHIPAFVNYEFRTKKYRGFQGGVGEWLESVGLPPTPPETVEAYNREYDRMIASLPNKPKYITPISIYGGRTWIK
jgi:hypothetical protein